jgi:ABC-type Fe3+-hydroxamate transport system substrate-binding protein
VRDDLDCPVPGTGQPARVVSLVPSLTEAIALTCPGVLVGATDWCTHPADLEVARLRGTKNPDLRAIVGLRPDLVVANQEENRRVDVDRLRATGIPVWVTRIDSVDEALTSMGRLLGEGLAVRAEPSWLAAARSVWEQPDRSRPGLRVAVPIWRDPWIWVGGGTYASDVLSRLGCVNVLDATARYPHVAVDDVLDQAPDVVLVPDEPYPFDTVPDELAGERTALIQGRPLFWYGPAMVTAPQQLRETLPSLTGLRQQPGQPHR